MMVGFLKDQPRHQVEESQSGLSRLLQDPQAPIWNYECSDELVPQDLARLDQFERFIRSGRAYPEDGSPTKPVIECIERIRQSVPFLREVIPTGYPLRDGWEELPDSSRENIARNLATFIPDDADLSRIQIYETSGTTGHALVIPKHPFAVGCYQSLTSFTLEQHGISFQPVPGDLANILICAQEYTVMYAATMASWNNALHAKVNLHPAAWRKPEDRTDFFRRWNPPLLTGDPTSFAEASRIDLPVKPRAILSTATTLRPPLRSKLEAQFCCPVIEWYSSNETGPIAYSCRDGNGMHMLSPDLFVEILDENGDRVAPGELGEITVSGGRNLYLPLLRYRTGDHGMMRFDPCSCGDSSPRLTGLSGRQPVVYMTQNATPVNSVDIARILRPLPIIQHRFTQHPDGQCEIDIVPMDGNHDQIVRQVKDNLGTLFGGHPIHVTILESTVLDEKKWVEFS